MKASVALVAAFLLAVPAASSPDEGDCAAIYQGLKAERRALEAEAEALPPVLDEKPNPAFEEVMLRLAGLDRRLREHVEACLS